MMFGITFHENIDAGNFAMAIVALFAWLLSFLAYSKSNKIARSSFLLEIRDKFQVERRYNTHITIKSNDKIENWADLDDYLGLFEICEIMIQNKSLEFLDFKKLYEYRLKTILQSKEVIYFKLVLERDKWDNLYLLLERCFAEHKRDFENLKKLAKKLSDKEHGMSDKCFLEIMERLSKISDTNL
jgi:hypothetical protein